MGQAYEHNPQESGERCFSGADLRMRALKRKLALTSAEYQLLFQGLLHFRNKLIQQGRYTDAVDELLIKLQKARKYRHG